MELGVAQRASLGLIIGELSARRWRFLRICVPNMKKYFSILFSLSFVFAAPIVVQAEEHDHTPLEDEMSAMNKSWRNVRRALRDPATFADAAKQVEAMIKHADNSIKMEPILLAEQEGDEAKKAFLEGYQKGMRETVALLKELQAAFEAGDAAAATELVGKINDARKEGHQKYKPEDDD